MKWKSKLAEAGLMVFPLSLGLPMPLIYKSIALGLFCLITAIYFLAMPKAYRRWPKYSLHYVFIMVFLAVTITTLIRDGYLFFDETRLSFLVLPLVMPLGSKLIRQYSDQILKAFLLGVLFYIGYAIVYVIYFYGWYNPAKTFSFDYYLKYVLYHYMPGAIHHTYMGLFLTFSMAVVLEIKTIKTGLKIPAILLLCASMPLIGSKWTLFAGIAVLGFWATKNYYNKARVWIIALITIFSIALLWAGTVTDLFRTFNQSLQKRIQLLQCSLEAAGEHWFLGMGKDSVKPWMESCTEANLAMDTHNIFLQELLTSGIFALLILLFILTKLFRLSSNCFLFSAFCGLILFYGLIEHLFNLQLGVTFFVFFSVLFLELSSAKSKGKLIETSRK